MLSHHSNGKVTKVGVDSALTWAGANSRRAWLLGTEQRFSVAYLETLRTLSTQLAPSQKWSAQPVTSRCTVPWMSFSSTYLWSLVTTCHCWLWGQRVFVVNRQNRGQGPVISKLYRCWLEKWTASGLRQGTILYFPAAGIGPCAHHLTPPKTQGLGISALRETITRGSPPFFSSA